MSTWRIILCSLASLLVASTGNAQIYLSGNVADVEPLSVPDGVYEVTLSVWSEAVGGELLWEQRYLDVRIRDGELPTHLGPVPTDLEVSGRWLEVLVEGRAVADRFQLSQVSGQVVSLDSGGLEFWDTSVRADVPFARLLAYNAGSPELAIHALAGADFQIVTGWESGGTSWSGTVLTLRNHGRLELEGGWDASLLDGSGYLMIGDEGTKNLVFDDNEIQARDSGSAAVLHLNYEGGAVKVGGTIIGSSDARLKQDIRTLQEGLDEVLELRPVSFAWRREPGKRRFGLVGQQVREVVGEVVYEGEDGRLGIAYQNLVPLLIRALQDQQTEIERLRTDLEELEGRIAGD